MRALNYHVYLLINTDKYSLVFANLLFACIHIHTIRMGFIDVTEPYMEQCHHAVRQHCVKRE